MALVRARAKILDASVSLSGRVIAMSNRRQAATEITDKIPEKTARTLKSAGEYKRDRTGIAMAVIP